MKRIVLWGLIVSLIFCTWPVFSYGSSVSDLRKEQEENKEKKKEAESNLKEAQIQKNMTLEEVNEIDAELSVVTEELLEIMENLQNTEELLAVTEVELETAEQDRIAQFEVMKKRVRYMYENGNSTYLHVLFNVDSFSDLLNKVEYVNRIIEYDTNMVAQYQEIEDRIAAKVDEIATRKNEIETLARQQEQTKQSLQKSLDEKNRLLLQIRQDEQKYSQQISDLEAADKEIQSLIQRAATSNVSISTNPYNGKLSWPVPGWYGTSSGYINRINPISGRREFHTGLDIPANTGTSIIAVEGGTVVSSGTQFSGFGYSVLIDHGNGLSTFYGHCSKLIARTGQRVQKGEVIALVGSTGYSTGPHCHFEVRINGSTVDPNSYVR